MNLFTNSCTPLRMLCQIKAAPPPPGASMFSKSTENFSEDKWYRRTIFNAPELVDTTLKYPGPGAYDPVLNASSRSRRSPVHQLSLSVPALHPCPCPPCILSPSACSDLI